MTLSDESFDGDGDGVYNDCGGNGKVDYSRLLYSRCKDSQVVHCSIPFVYLDYVHSPWNCCPHNIAGCGLVAVPVAAAVADDGDGGGDDGVVHHYYCQR